MRALFSYGIAALLIVVGALWLGSGTLVAGGNGPGKGEKPIVALIEKDGGPITEALEENNLFPEHHAAAGEIDPELTIAQRVAQTSGAQAGLQSVRTETYMVRPMPIEVPLRGRTKAKSSVTVTPETSGVVTAVNVEKGERVNVGDIICTLEEGDRHAALAQAEAALAQAQTELDTNAELRQKGVSPANTAAQFETALKSAQVAFNNAATELERTRVKTQIAGVVQDPMASVGSMLNPGAPCATVVELDPMLFVGTVPEARISLAKEGLSARVETVNGHIVEGTVSYIASVADEATRSFPVEIQVPNPDGKVFSGVTATATVSMGTAPAHLLPQSVLTLDDEGRLGVRSVKDGVVEFHPVTIVSDSREGVWVTGLPPRLDIIIVGQEYVTAGQQVAATNISDGAGSGQVEAAAGVQP